MTFKPPSQIPAAPEAEPLPKQGVIAAAPSRSKRLLLLIVCIALGLVVGCIGQGITSQSAWFLAVPVCIAIGWIFVADPGQCVAPQCAPRQDDSVR